MPIEFLDPSYEQNSHATLLASRLERLAGQRVAFISNGKEGTKGFFTHLEAILRENWEVAEVIHRTKSNYSAPMDAVIAAEIPGWDAVVTGLGD